jgi:hypothetical protein
MLQERNTYPKNTIVACPVPKVKTEAKRLNLEKKKKEGGNAAIFTKIKTNNHRIRSRMARFKTTLKPKEVRKLSINTEKNKTKVQTNKMYEYM